jgi:hypothetical protein
MPLLDAYIPEGALSASAERQLLARITDLLLEYEGVDPQHERARPLAWVFVHRPQVYVAGAPPKSPRLPLHLSGPRRPVRRRASCRGDGGDDAGRGGRGGRRLAASRVSRVRLHLRGPGRLVGRSGTDPQARGHLRARLAAEARREWGAS